MGLAHFSAPSSHLPLHDFAHPSPIARWLQEANFAQIGICIEPLLDIVGATPASHAAAPTLSDFVQFMQATVENFYQFVTSFTTPREEASCSLACLHVYPCMACYCRPSSCQLVFRKSLANFGCAKPPQFPPADITVELPVPVSV